MKDKIIIAPDDGNVVAKEHALSFQGVLGLAWGFLHTLCV